MYNVSMPKNKKISLNIDLLRPQGEPQKIPVRLLHWILSAGRYLIIIVEIVVLAAFVSRFKLDNDLAETKDEIDLKAPFVQALKPDEILVKKLKFQLTSIRDLKGRQTDFVSILDNIAAQTPGGVTLSNLAFENSPGSVQVKITGNAQNNDQLATLVYGLKSGTNFQDVNIASIGLDKGLINFTINCKVTMIGASL